MTDGTLAVLAGISMVVSIVAQVADAYETKIGLDAGDTEIGIINRLFIKSKADESKLALVTFLEGVATLALFGGAYAVAGPAGALAFAGVHAAFEVFNDVRSFLLLKKQHKL